MLPVVARPLRCLSLLVFFYTSRTPSAPDSSFFILGVLFFVVKLRLILAIAYCYSSPPHSTALEYHRYCYTGALVFTSEREFLIKTDPRMKK